MSRIDFLNNNHGVKQDKRFKFKDKYGIIPFSILISIIVTLILMGSKLMGK